jgi:ribosomal protein S27E
MTDSREHSCPRCGAFLVKSTAPSGWLRVFCKACKSWQTLHLGKEQRFDPHTRVTYSHA